MKENINAIHGQFLITCVLSHSTQYLEFKLLAAAMMPDNPLRETRTENGPPYLRDNGAPQILLDQEHPH